MNPRRSAQRRHREQHKRAEHVTPSAINRPSRSLRLTSNTLLSMASSKLPTKRQLIEGPDHPRGEGVVSFKLFQDATSQSPGARARGIRVRVVVKPGAIAVLEHQTRFCTAPDGVGLAFAIDGEGPPLVKAGNWMTHLDYDRQSPVWRHWVKELSRGHALIRYDERGCGLSDRQFDGTPTLDTYVEDLAVVVDAAGLERFALFGVSGGGPTAIEYAVRNPDRVSRLVLYGTYTRGRYKRGERETEQSRLLIDLMRVGWGGAVPAFRQVFSAFFIPSASEEQKRWYDEMQQVSSSGEMAARLWLSNTQIDITDAARRITQPTLVLHARHDLAVPYEEGRRMASLVPDTRFVTLESDNHILQIGRAHV